MKMAVASPKFIQVEKTQATPSVYKFEFSPRAKCVHDKNTILVTVESVFDLLESRYDELEFTADVWIDVGEASTGRAPWDAGTEAFIVDVDNIVIEHSERMPTQVEAERIVEWLRAEQCSNHIYRQVQDHADEHHGLPSAANRWPF